MKYARLSAIVGSVAALAVVPASGIAGGTPTPPKDPCKANPASCPTVKQGRMTGHGHYIDPSLGKVQWEFRNSICGKSKFPNLKVEWGGKRYVLKAYTGGGLVCLDTPVDEGQPRAGFDTIVGQGTGTLNGKRASATFRFTDAGEPGRDDTANIRIVDAKGKTVLNVVNQRASAGGNHQAHRR